MLESFVGINTASLHSTRVFSVTSAVGGALLSHFLIFSSLSYTDGQSTNSKRSRAEECTSDDYMTNVFLPLDSTHELPNSTCLLRFSTPDFATPPDGTYRRSKTNFPFHRLVALIGRPQNESADLCGFCRARQSDLDDEDPEWASITKQPLVVRRCVGQRSATSVFHPYSRAVASGATASRSWNAMIAWSRAPLTVRFDGSCANSDLYFVTTYERSWNICRQMANGSRVSFYPFTLGSRTMDYFTIFAQDRELSSWLPLPDEYACRDGRDYELVFSGARGGENIEIVIHMAPSSDSCRVLCVSEQCDLDYRSGNRIYIEVNVSRPLRVEYRLRSAATLCESNTDTGFALRFGFRDPWPAVTLTTRERDSLVRAAQYVDAHSSSTDKHWPTTPDTKVLPLDPLEIATEPSEASRIASIASGCFVTLVVLVTLLVFVARWAKRKCVQGLKETQSDLLTNPNNGDKRSKACDAIIKYGDSFSTVSREGNPSLSDGAAKRSTSRAGSQAKQAEQNLSTSELYAEIEDVEPLSNELKRSADGSITLRFFRDGTEQGLVDNVKKPFDRPSAALSASCFLSPGTGSPECTVDEPVYCEIDVPDAHYTVVTTSNDASQYSGLL